MPKAISGMAHLSNTGNGWDFNLTDLNLSIPVVAFPTE